jgi:hypothetical protein
MNILYVDYFSTPSPISFQKAIDSKLIISLLTYLGLDLPNYLP